MSVDLRLPNINGATEKEQLVQLKSYIYQLVEQLNWALMNIETTVPKASSAQSAAASSSDSGDPAATFNDVKALIIKSADIVNAYYDEINRRLEGVYVAESDFGVFSEKTTSTIQENSTNIETLFTNVQKLDSSVSGIIDVFAYINTGILYYGDNGVPVYGLEIGQRTKIDGAETFNKYARFTSDRLSFYDRNDNEVAYISDKKLYINHVEVVESFTIGKFVDRVQSDGSVVTKWIG